MHLPGLLGLRAFRCPRALRASSPAPLKGALRGRFLRVLGLLVLWFGEGVFLSFRELGNQFCLKGLRLGLGHGGSGVGASRLGLHGLLDASSGP